MTLAGRVFSNRYEIQRELAQGGMAEVYLARDQLLGRPVALKALFPEYAREPSFVERFRREAQAAANLNHPNIVAIYDWGQESGTYFIVMEYVEGRALRDLIRSEAPLDPNQVAEIGAEIASALAFAHRSGVVHRDVKPGNVLLTRSGNVKVTDFGIARAGASDGLTQTGSVMGTATYFSPEQAQGQAVDGRSDVYTLGVVLYEMVTGVAPFTGDSPVSVAYKHVREDPVAPSQRNPDVPPDLEQIVMTALAKDAGQRYQTADDLRADLLRFRRGRPLAASPVTAIVSEVPTTATAAAAGAAYAATMATPAVNDRGRATDGTTYAKKKRHTALIWIGTILALIAVIGGILFVATRLSEKQVAVPNLVGEQVGVAQERLEDLGLKSKVEPKADPTAPKGQVLDQQPKDGNLEEGSTVTLVVSAGAGEEQVPFDITNKPADAVEKQLKDLGFGVERQQKADESIVAFNVITTDPAPGTFAPVGSRVIMIVSSGPAPVRVPPVENLPHNQAIQAIQQAGFPSPQVINEASNTIAAGEAIRTDPGAGTEVPRDTVLKLYISTGIAQKPVPPVIGKPIAEARAEIEAAGFTVSTRNAIDPANIGNVVDQSPAGGSNATPGSNVTLTVGIAEPTSTTTTTEAP